jgi:hypothetical protein
MQAGARSAMAAGAIKSRCSFSDQMLKFFISFDEVDQLGV